MKQYNAVNAKDIVTTGKVTEDVRHTEDNTKKDPDQKEDDYTNETKYLNCQQNYPTL